MDGERNKLRSRRHWRLAYYALAVSHDGNFIALGGEVILGRGAPSKQQIAIVDTAQRAIVRTIPDTVDVQFGRLAWSPDGTRLTAIWPTSVGRFSQWR